MPSEIDALIAEELRHTPTIESDVPEDKHLKIEIDQEAPLEQWRFLPWHEKMSEPSRLAALRLNALGSLYFFGKVVLKMDRFVGHLHGKWAKSLEVADLRLVLEAPRDHLKTSLGSVTLPIWWALPFDSKEEDWMRALGYGDEWVRHMKRLHSVNNRTIIASQTEENIIKIGIRIDAQYKSNDLFRDVFHDLIPGTGANWNQSSMTHKRNSSSGEGTYDLISAGSALQSRHYDKAVEDDLFGEKALYSPSVAEQVIEWHQRLPGAFDTDKLAPGFRNLELIIGNRWGMYDFNGWIRENNPTFRFERHSALGGCCDEHPAGEPIFPEEFSAERLNDLRIRFGPRGFAAQYLNQPITEEECTFRDAWLGKIRLFQKECGIDVYGEPQKKTVIEHIPGKSGVVRQDIAVSDLDRILILDPNHGGETGRARHAAIVVGVRRQDGKKGQKELYLLESWAKAVSHDAMAAHVGQMALRWHANTFYVETIAGQDGWLRYFERDLYDKNPKMIVRALPKERGAGAKERRILSMSPLYERGQVHVRASGGGVEDFMQEYSMHPQAKTVDLLDCMGYLFNIVETAEVDMSRWKENYERDMDRRRRSVGKAGY
jgi:hypothetical protein